MKSRQSYLCIYTGHHRLKVVAYSDAMCSPKVVAHNCNRDVGQSKLYLWHSLGQCEQGSNRHRPAPLPSPLVLTCVAQPCVHTLNPMQLAGLQKTKNPCKDFLLQQPSKLCLPDNFINQET